MVRLLRQLTGKQQMVAVVDAIGRLRAGTGPVGWVQQEYWKKVMVSPPTTVEDCMQYIEGIGNTHQWEVTLPRLWKEPSADTVLTALERLDPNSAPGEDGIPAELYRSRTISAQECYNKYMT